MITRYFVAFLLFSFPLVSMGSSGAPLTWDEKTGDIEDVTDQYFYLNFNEKRLVLSVNDRKLVFPSCIRRFFDHHDSRKVMFEVGVQYEATPKPEYYVPRWITLGVFPDNREYKLTLTFNSDTMIPLGFYVGVKESGNLWNSFELKISDSCVAAIKENTSTEIPPNLRRAR